MKKKIAVLAVLVICLAVPGTLACFSGTGIARNVITAGSVRIRLKENARLDDGTLVPYEQPGKVLPGQRISKIVTVANVGSSAAYVRLLVDREITLQGHRQADPSMMELELNTACWTEKDGAYYYNTPLAPGEETEPLFTAVTFSGDMDELYQQANAAIHVAAQATQTANNGDDALHAAGWPMDGERDGSQWQED